MLKCRSFIEFWEPPIFPFAFFLLRRPNIFPLQVFSSFSFSVLLLFISPKFFLLFLGKGSSLTRSICHFLVHFLVVIFVFEVIPLPRPAKSPRIAKQYQSAQNISLDIATERSFPFWGAYSIIDIPFFIWDSICCFRVSFGKTRRKKFKHQAPSFEL